MPVADAVVVELNRRVSRLERVRDVVIILAAVLGLGQGGLLILLRNAEQRIEKLHNYVGDIDAERDKALSALASAKRESEAAVSQQRDIAIETIRNSAEPIAEKAVEDQAGKRLDDLDGRVDKIYSFAADPTKAGFNQFKDAMTAAKNTRGR